MKIPNSTDQFWVGNAVSRPWYAYLCQFEEFAGATDTELAAVIARIVALENAPNDRAVGLYSISGSGQLSLVGDTDAPGSTYFYGTSALGEKGWQAFADAIADGVAVTKTVDINTGVITLDLADTAVTPGSYTSANITVDQQGRITAAANGSAEPFISATAAEALPAMTPVHFGAAGVYVADAAASKPAHGYVRTAVSAAATANVYASGLLTTTGLTAGTTYYLRAAGAIGAALLGIGDIRQPVGVAISTTELAVSIGDPITRTS